MDEETNLRIGWIMDSVNLSDEQEAYILSVVEEAESFNDLPPDVKIWLAHVESEAGVHPDYQQAVAERAQQVLQLADGKEVE